MLTKLATAWFTIRIIRLWIRREKERGISLHRIIESRQNISGQRRGFVIARTHARGESVFWTQLAEREREGEKK